jgi:LPXTG-motif cell wall-anchored protein
MLTLAYIFFLVMFVGDLFVGVLQKNNSLIIGGIVMTLIASVFIFLINKKK